MGADESTCLSPVLYYLDSDGDGYGDPDMTSYTCFQPSGFLLDNTDCNDSSSSINPDAAEIWYDGTDQDCDGWNDYDQDRDTYVDLNWNAQAGGTSPGTNDCNDINPHMYPGGPPARVVKPSSTYHATLQDAYDNALDGETIQSQDLTLSGDLNINGNKSIIISGGYDCPYATVTGKTTVSGNMIISNGSVEVEHLVLQ